MTPQEAFVQNLLKQLTDTSMARAQEAAQYATDIAQRDAKIATLTAKDVPSV